MKGREIFSVLVMLLVCSVCFCIPVHIHAATIIEEKNIKDFATAAVNLCAKYDSLENSAGLSARNSTVESKYALKRLIVKSNGKSISVADCGAVKILKGPNSLYVLQFDSIGDTSAAAQKLEKQKNIQYVEADQKISLPTEASSTHLSKGSAYGTWSWGVKYMGIDKLAQQVKSVAGSSSIKVAIVDTGIYKHSAFSSHVISGHSFVPREASSTDSNGHGTHVTGVVYDCLRGFNVKFLPIKVLDQNGDGNSLLMGLGIMYAADNKAKVVNMSANLVEKHGSSNSDYYLHDCIKYAVDKNVVVVNSAGNGGQNVAYSCPADVVEAIVVGAIDKTGSIAYFSNTGKTVDVVAPGVDIYSTFYNPYFQNRYVTLSGTSMAAPHITGLAALVRLAYPSYSARKVESVIKGYAKDLGVSGKDNVYGYGMPYVSNVKLNIITNIILNKQSMNMTVGDSDKLVATITPENATLKEVLWSSSNSNVAAVTKTGEVIARAEGTAIITGKTLNNKSDVCKVTVTKRSKLSKASFYWSGYNSSTKRAVVTLKQCDNATGLQVQLETIKKKTISTQTGKTSVIFKDLSNHSVYYYRARPYYDISGYRIYGTWSDRRTFSTAYATIQKSSPYKSVKIITPKVSGIEGFDVLVAASNTSSSYQKVKTVVPGQCFSLSSLDGKLLASYGSKYNFYIRLKPIYSILGAKDEKFVTKSFTLK